MTTEKILTRAYNLTDSLLKQTADGIVINIERDIDDFTDRGITQDRIDAFNDSIILFDGLPYDDISLGNVVIATQDKEAKGEKLKKAIRSIRMVAENAFGTFDGNYRIYHFDRLNNQPDDVVHRLARSVVEIASQQLISNPEIVAEGLTQTMITNITLCDVAFDAAIDNQTKVIRKRDTDAQARIKAGNVVFKEMRKLCNVGKDLYYDDDPARYNDYLIYNTADGTPPPTGEFGAMKGVVKDSMTLDEVDNGLFFLDGVETPIEIDTDGTFESDMVPVGCTHGIITSYGKEDKHIYFTIIPDEEITVHIFMDAVSVEPPHGT
ncbi:MAG: hypothetical protein WCQ41_10075 [Bacillota bacterium]